MHKNCIWHVQCMHLCAEWIGLYYVRCAQCTGIHFWFRVCYALNKNYDDELQSVDWQLWYPSFHNHISQNLSIQLWCFSSLDSSPYIWFLSFSIWTDQNMHAINTLTPFRYWIEMSMVFFSTLRTSVYLASQCWIWIAFNTLSQCTDSENTQMSTFPLKASGHGLAWLSSSKRRTMKLNEETSWIEWTLSIIFFLLFVKLSWYVLYSRSLFWSMIQQLLELMKSWENYVTNIERRDSAEDEPNCIRVYQLQESCRKQINFLFGCLLLFDVVNCSVDRYSCIVFLSFCSCSLGWGGWRCFFFLFFELCLTCWMGFNVVIYHLLL